MHFLMPHVFASHAEFKDWFWSPLAGIVDGGVQDGKNGATPSAQALPGGQVGNSNHPEVVERLHNVLRPFLLRRLKVDVEKKLPGKTEVVVKCRLSRRQRQLYDDFLAKGETQATLRSGQFLGLLNVLMQLRKVRGSAFQTGRSSKGYAQATSTRSPPFPLPSPIVCAADCIMPPFEMHA